MHDCREEGRCWQLGRSRLCTPVLLWLGKGTTQLGHTGAKGRPPPYTTTTGWRTIQSYWAKY